jgi:hypothetical protein
VNLCAKSAINIIIVSGRPDDRFASWQEFSVFRVEPLDKQQVIQLVDKIDFDLNVKKKFIEAIEKNLYLKRKDFLSSPLLASMMLLTFSAMRKYRRRFIYFMNWLTQPCFQSMTR